VSFGLYQIIAHFTFSLQMRRHFYFLVAENTVHHESVEFAVQVIRRGTVTGTVVRFILIMSLSSCP